MNKRPNAIETISLTENSFWTHIPECGGVYFIHSYNNQIPIRLNRVLGTDEEGVLKFPSDMEFVFLTADGVPKRTEVNIV